MSAMLPLTAALTSRLQATTVVAGLTIVTKSYQSSPTSGHALAVTLQ
jgi:hypothetical protein